MPTYEELKSELIEISAIVEKFPEAVRPQVYELLVTRYLGGDAVDATTSATATKPSEAKRAPAKPKRKADTAPRKPSSKESYSIDRNLNLRGDGSIPSFKEFFEEKSPQNAKQINAVSVYYLRKMMEMAEVTLDHVYTCYSAVGKKPPKAFRQSFIDTKNKDGWIEFDQDGNLDIPHRGTVYVEHDLPSSSGD